MKSNFVLVGLNENITKQIADAVASDLNMFFLDINDLIKYNFSDEEVISKVGMEYFDRQVKKLIASASEYENTVINCPYDLFLQEENLQALKNKAIVIFISIDKNCLQIQNRDYVADKKLDIVLLAYEELSKSLEQEADIKIEYNGKDIKQIIKNISVKIKNFVG